MTGFTSCGDEWNIGVARTGYMKKNSWYCGQIRCYNECSTRCSPDQLHPRLQHQTQAYPAQATYTLFAVIVLMDPTCKATLDHKCLIYSKLGLNVTQLHNITYSANDDLVVLESFEVLWVEGGTRYDSLDLRLMTPYWRFPIGRFDRSVGR